MSLKRPAAGGESCKQDSFLYVLTQGLLFVLYYAILKIMHNIIRYKSISAVYNSTICPFSTSYLQYLPFPEING